MIIIGKSIDDFPTRLYNIWKSINEWCDFPLRYVGATHPKTLRPFVSKKIMFLSHPLAICRVYTIFLNTPKLNGWLQISPINIHCYQSIPWIMWIYVNITFHKHSIWNTMNTTHEYHPEYPMNITLISHMNTTFKIYPQTSLLFIPRVGFVEILSRLLGRPTQEEKTSVCWMTSSFCPVAYLLLYTYNSDTWQYNNIWHITVILLYYNLSINIWQ